ncbi:hypothetical protein [Oleiagrimonas soli]|uniref:Uncharacterized protein n=1 Tax=Oleiagrimonas soli TaxID=1543381 RepID=A0A841KIB7_9GAMM|nr:hypothetical protein [Oleiagrimonas soli]MBB6184785.1 hypothetical protein [Oleiagrimonas soli]
MTGLLILLLVSASAVWVYLDASRNEIGHDPNRSGLFNMSAGAWGLASLLIWIIGFPAYIIKRKSLVEHAKSNPHPVKNRLLKSFGFAATGLLLIAFTVFNQPAQALPSCTDPHVTNLLMNVLRTSPAGRSGIIFSQINDSSELHSSVNGDFRMCRASVIADGSDVDIQYSVKWQDKDHTAFVVETLRAD